MFARLYRFLALRPYWIAFLIAVFLCIWMLSTPANQVVNEQSSSENTENLPKVQVTRFVPEKITQYLTLYGRSEAHSRAVIRTQVAGEIIKVNVVKGGYVKPTDNIASIEKNALIEQLAQADALYDERLLNYNAAKSLNERGLQGRAHLAEANSLLFAAKSSLKLLQLQLQHTQINAPFSGFLQEQFAQLGDYLQVGEAIFSLESLDPIIIRGDTTEHYIQQLRVGEKISATLLSGEEITGQISYIAAHADPKSATFRVEGEFANPDFKIVSGLSAKLSIPLTQVDAIHVSPATLAMDAQGNLGIKSVVAGVVEFKSMNLVDADNAGVWLSGFSQAVDIITLGQGFVKPGDRVEAIVAEH